MKRGAIVYEVGDEAHKGFVREIRKGKAFVQWSGVFASWVALDKLVTIRD